MDDLITPELIARVIRKALLPGEDYRTEIVDVINRRFLETAMAFFRQVVDAKMKDKKINVDWYKDTMMGDLPPKERAVNAGINPKTVQNIYGSARKEILIQAADDNYQSVKDMIETLMEENEGVDLMLTIKFKKVSVELDMNESLLVINALAVKRAAMRGGYWSAVGKRAEKPLMLTLCHIHDMLPKNYSVVQKVEDNTDGVAREIDFFLLEGKVRYKCEMKLLGKGNPESVDAVIARDSQVFVADTLSEQNIKQLDNLGVEWVHLKEDNGWRRFADILSTFKIPHKKYEGDLAKGVDAFIKKAMS